ncbi:MAG TPA: acyltransferase [Ktedonobacteraceae bacterium]|nr:acyltransferase [Ktedonobacteraceae bacterium]
MAIATWIHTGLEDASKKNTIAVLDGVRAFACLIVIWYHLSNVPHDLHIWNLRTVVPPLLASFLSFGKYGVTLFFVLSGFLLFMPFAKALLFKQRWPSSKRFYLRRVFRIVPAYYLTLILIVLFYMTMYEQPRHWKELGLFFLFLMDSTHATYKQLNAPFWTLAIEWQFYMLLPLLMLAMRLLVWRIKQNSRLPATFACILALIVWGLFSRYIGNYLMYAHPTATWLVPRPVLNGILFFTYGQSGKYFEDFGVGMLLALCFVYAQHPSTLPAIRATLQKLSPLFCGIGFAGLIVMILWNYNEAYRNTWPLFNHPFFIANYYLFSEIGYALSFGLCILALLFGATLFTGPFTWLPLRWLGMISYSLYMWHFPLLVFLMKHGQPFLKNLPLALNYGVYWLWVLVVIIPFCFLFYMLVERSSMKLGELLTHQKRRGETAAGQARESGQTQRAVRSHSCAHGSRLPGASRVEHT